MHLYPDVNGEFLVNPDDESEVQTISDAAYEALTEVVRSCVENDVPINKKIAAGLIHIANNTSMKEGLTVDSDGKSILQGALRMYASRGIFLEELTHASEHGSYTGYRNDQRQLAAKMLKDLEDKKSSGNGAGAQAPGTRV